MSLPAPVKVNLFDLGNGFREDEDAWFCHHLGTETNVNGTTITGFNYTDPSYQAGWMNVYTNSSIEALMTDLNAAVDTAYGRYDPGQNRTKDGTLDDDGICAMTGHLAGQNYAPMHTEYRNIYKVAVGSYIIGIEVWTCYQSGATKPMNSCQLIESGFVGNQLSHS